MAHRLMGIAMAGMLHRQPDHAPNVVWEVLFGLLTAWFAYRAWADARQRRPRPGGRALRAAPGSLRGDAVHVPRPRCHRLRRRAAWAAWAASAAQTLSYPTLAGAFALLLVGYSVWDLNQLSSRRYSLATVGAPAADPVVPGSVASGSGTPGLTPAVRAFLLAPGTRLGWDVALGIGMAFMLVIMI